MPAPGAILGPNRAHPLNQGCANWLLALPHLFGGGRWIDLLGNNHGKLILGSKPRPSSRPGGFGHIVGDGATVGQFVDCGDNIALYSLKQLSVFAWVCPFFITFNETIVSKWDYATQGSFTLAHDPSTLGCMIVFIANAVNDAGNNKFQSTTKPLVLNTWAHVGFVYDGTQPSNAGKLAVYANGLLQAGSYLGTIPATLTAATSTIKIGNFGGTLNNRPWNGAIDDVRIYNRALPSQQVSELFQDSLTSYPGTLLRVPKAGTVTAPSTGFLLRREINRRTGSRSPSLIGGGL